MSIFDSLFKSAPAPAPVAQAPAQAGQLPGNVPVPAPQHPPAGQNPGMPTQQSQFGVPAAAPAGAPAAPVNPLDEFNDLFAAPKPALNPDGSPIVAAPTVAVAYDQAAVAQKLQGMDFTRFADPKDMAAVAAGGEGAVAAMGNMMNAMMRQAMLMQTGFAAQSANTAADFAYQRAQGGIPELVRGQLTQAQLAENQFANHPALAPMVTALSQQFQTQYPKATPAEVAAHVGKYMQAVSGAFAPKQETPAAGGQNGQQQSTDWGQWMAT